MVGSIAFAQVAPNFALDGQLYADAAGTIPLLDSGAITVQILDPSLACVLYEEQQVFDTTATAGFLHADIGSLPGASKRRGTTGLDSNHLMSDVYSNVGTSISGKVAGGAGCAYVPAAGDARAVRVIVHTTSDNATRTLAPDLALGSAPTALVAERAETLRGLVPSDLLQLATPGNTDLTQANVEYVFQNFATLTSLLSSGGAVNTGSGAGQIVQENANAQIAQTLGSAMLPAYTFAGSTNTGVYSPGAGQLALAASGSAALLVTAAGNVAIGTTTAADPLTVVGNARFNGNVLGSNRVYGNFGFIGAPVSGSEAPGGNLTIDSTVHPTKGSISLAPSGGNVGIGTSNALGILHVAGSASQSATNWTYLTGNVGTSLPSSSAGAGLYVGWNQSGGQGETNLVASGTGGSDKGSFAFARLDGGTYTENMRIASTGYIGIGTSAPTEQLQIGSYTTGANRYLKIATTTGSSPGIRLRQNNDNWGFDIEANDPLGLNFIRYDNGTVANAMTIQRATGNVGIGTTSPGSALDVVGAAHASTGFFSTLFQDPFGCVTLGNNAYGGAVGNNCGGSDFVVRASNVDTLMVKGSGNVGINSAQPASGLDVATTGTAASAIIVPRDTVANRPTTPVNGMIRYASDAAKFEVYQGGAWQSINVGTSGSPLSSFTAAAASNAIDNSNFAQTWNWSTATTQALLSINANALTTGSAIAVSSSSPNLQSTSGLLSIANTGTSTTGLVARVQANSTPSSGLTVLANGNVGIGSSTPVNTLDVAGTLTTSTLLTNVIVANGPILAQAWHNDTYAPNSSTTSIPETGYVQMRVANPNNADGRQALISFTPNNSNGNAQQAYITAQSVAGSSSWTPVLAFGLGTSSSSYLERMRIDSTGLIGIGSSAPRAMLDVGGAIISSPAVIVATSAVDFSNGNIQYTSQSCRAFQLSNLKDGGNFSLVIKGTTSATCNFTAYAGSGTTGALTVHLPPGHGATTTGTHTLYTFLVAGSDVYVNWIPGY